MYFIGTLICRIIRFIIRLTPEDYVVGIVDGTGFKVLAFFKKAFNRVD